MMRNKFRFLLLVLSLLFVQVAWAEDDDYLIRAPARIGFQGNIQIGDLGSNCGWAGPMMPHLMKRAAHGEILIPFNDERSTPYVLSITFLSAGFEGEGRYSRFAAHVRGDIRYLNKLVATRDFKTYEYFKPNQSPCQAMRDLGISISDSIDSWTQRVELIPCKEGCTGLHPQTPILVAHFSPTIDSKSADPEMLAECKWQNYMVPMVLDSYQQQVEAPFPPIEVRKESFENPDGRTLKLTVGGTHVMGGSGFTGPKWLTVHAELVDGGRVIFSQRATRRVMNGYFSRCDTLEWLSKGVAYDVARMLAAPGVAKREVD